MVRNTPPVLTPLDTSGVHRKVAPGHGSAAIELGDTCDHIQRLKQVSGTTKSLVDLLGAQLQVLTETVPLLRGFEIVKEIRDRLKECHGAEDAFRPLRDYIEQEKALFYTKNVKAIENIIRQRVEEGVKRRLPALVKEQLGRYEEHIKTNSVLADKVKGVVAITSARTNNSILCPNYPDEQVSLIPPRPNLSGMTLGNLKNIGGPAAIKLARDQGLTPHEDSSNPEFTRARNLNMILRHIGVQYQGIPSRNGLILTSVTRSRNL